MRRGEESSFGSDLSSIGYRALPNESWFRGHHSVKSASSQLGPNGQTLWKSSHSSARVSMTVPPISKSGAPLTEACSLRMSTPTSTIPCAPARDPHALPWTVVACKTGGARCNANAVGETPSVSSVNDGKYSLMMPPISSNITSPVVKFSPRPTLPELKGKPKPSQDIPALSTFGSGASRSDTT